MIINRKQLKELRKSGEKFVVCAGCFDLFHIGHLNIIKMASEEVKLGGGKLLVIVLSDADVRVLKGEDRPIIPILQRAKIIDSLEMVDYVITTPPNSIKKSQNSARENVLWQKYWPIVRDSGASLAMRVDGTPPSFIKHLRNHGIEIIKHTRTRNISTNKIVEQIKKN